MTLAEALIAEQRGQGAVRFVGGVPVWTSERVRFALLEERVVRAAEPAKRRGRR